MKAKKIILAKVKHEHPSKRRVTTTTTKKTRVQEENPPERPVPVPVQEEISLEDDVWRILRENPGWIGEIDRLTPDALVQMGVRDVVSTSEHVSATPLLEARKKDMTIEERTLLDKMRERRTSLVNRVHTLIDTRIMRGFVCQDEDWIVLVKNLVVVAVVGAEGMRGPFDFKSWFLNVSQTEKVLDMDFVRRKNITVMDFKLMVAVCLFAFVMACRYVHLPVRESDVIPSMKRGNLLHVMRVLFGTFWGPKHIKRDTDVLTLASMMVASVMTENALEFMPRFLTEIGIPQTEWPLYVLHRYYPIAMFQHITTTTN